MEEARLWNDMLLYLESQLNLPPNTFKVSVIVESIYAVLELDEIIFTLKHRIVGLNAGRWNYMFSLVKTFKHHLNSLIPPRTQIRNSDRFLHTFNQYVVHIAHKRGIHAIGGTSNQIPRMH